jgi:phosphoglycerate-specific signal transduction histidine kinase
MLSMEVRMLRKFLGLSAAVLLCFSAAEAQKKRLNLSSRFTQPATLMDSYMRGASDAIETSDLDSAKDLMTKAERQIEVLEKLLNR